MPQTHILKFIHYILALLWIYQGLIPKLLFLSTDEIMIWQSLGLPLDMAKVAGYLGGVIEILFGVLFLIHPHQFLHYLNILGMIGLLFLMLIVLPHTIIASFNPVVMNVAMASLSVVALLLLRQSTDQK